MFNACNIKINIKSTKPPSWYSHPCIGPSIMTSELVCMNHGIQHKWWNVTSEARSMTWSTAWLLPLSPSLGSLGLGEPSHHVLSSPRKGPHGVKLRPPAKGYVREPFWNRVSALVKPSDACSPDQHTYCNLTRDWAGTTQLSRSASLTQKPRKIINICCFKLLKFGIISYPAIDNWYVRPKINCQLYKMNEKLYFTKSIPSICSLQHKNR